ncbi:MAG: peptidoglycan DD-metalloendopeptidase family protein, partial [Novosphingobium sp.]
LIIEANGLKAPYALKIGQKLVIPRRRGHTVKDGETGFGIALDHGVPWSAIATASGIDPKDAVKPGQKLTIPTAAKTAPPAPAPTPSASASPAPTPSPSASPAALTDTPAPAFRWPLEGKVRRPFIASPKDTHEGIDVLADKGTAVRAAAAGKVIFAGDGPKEYGKTVILFHGGRWTTTYSYLDQITVKDGEDVGAGERIGFNGQTGLADQPQLHFEIRKNRVALDPAKYLPKAKAAPPAKPADKAKPAKPKAKAT